MKKITGFIVGATLFCALSTAQADVIAPDALIKNTVQDVVTIIKQDKEIQSGNERKIAALVDAKVVPHFDFVRMTQLAIGKNWRSATPAQKEALVTGFRNMLVRTYTKVFTVYRDQAIDVKPLKMSADDSEVTVKTTISKPGTQSIPVDYEMKKAADGWKVFDISIEGVSMVLSYRGTLTSQIQQNGIDGLIKTLSDPADDAVKAKAK
jgi:phospholipid transport system substrate-binding protein